MIMYVKRKSFERF